MQCFLCLCSGTTAPAAFRATADGATADAGRPVVFTDEHTVFVKHLGDVIDESDLQQLFAGCGEIKGIRLKRDPDGRSRVSQQPACHLPVCAVFDLYQYVHFVAQWLWDNGYVVNSDCKQGEWLQQIEKWGLSGIWGGFIQGIAH